MRYYGYKKIPEKQKLPLSLRVAITGLVILFLWATYNAAMADVIRVNLPEPVEPVSCGYD